ncbi:MAG: NAD-dependent epimerase/dehydratase family protein [bacterium]|nr:NAD-dependent epimerase/dehydratase family protein [bacterium]
MKALVTGGTGFLGSHIARELHQQGHSVRVLHRASSKLTALEGIPFESALGDILDSDALRTACEGCDWVFHVAAVADYWRSDKQKMFEANVEGTRRVLHAARESGIKRVIFTSSAAAVGLRTDGDPSHEFDLFNHPPEAFPYGYSKHLAEGVVKAVVQAGQDVVIVNPSVVMGPGDLNMISGSFITQIKRLQWLAPVTSGGIAVTDVRDVARWHVAAAERGRTGERYILSTANYSYQDWFGMIAETVGVARPFLRTPDFVPPIVAAAIGALRRFRIPTPIDATQARMGRQFVYFDARKAWAELGQPQVDMHTSLRDTYQWYLEHGFIKTSPVEAVIARVGRMIGRK